MNRTIKEATVYRYYYASSEKLKQHLQAFLNAYNFAKQLKTLQGLTLYEFILNCWTNHPEKFKINPSHLNMKPYNLTGLNLGRQLLFKACFELSAWSFGHFLFLLLVGSLKNPLFSDFLKEI